MSLPCQTIPSPGDDDDTFKSVKGFLFSFFSFQIRVLQSHADCSRFLKVCDSSLPSLGVLRNGILCRRALKSSEANLIGSRKLTGV